jgi:hypothetical protein
MLQRYAALASEMRYSFYGVGEDDSPDGFVGSDQENRPRSPVTVPGSRPPSPANHAGRSSRPGLTHRPN